MLALDGLAIEADVKATLNGPIFCQHFTVRNVVIGSNSLVAVGWVLSTSNRLVMNLQNEPNQIDYQTKEVQCIEVRHMLHEANSEADLLSKEGCNR